MLAVPAQQVTTYLQELSRGFRFKTEWLSDADLYEIKAACSEQIRGPFGNAMRATLLHPTEDRPQALKGLGGLLGTYGFIKDAQAYAVGAIHPAPYALHDFGYLMEGVVLKAEELGVGSCWLGGSFRPGLFGAAIRAQEDEVLPAVIALGYPSDKRRMADKLIELHHSKGNRRAAWESRFFDRNDFDVPAPIDEGIALALFRAVHAAPSSCNTQPWRVVRDEGRFHFFFQRNPRYSQKDRLIGNADLQQIDMGIAMRHFEVAAQACGLPGQWRILGPSGTKHVPAEADYLVSWID